MYFIVAKSNDNIESYRSYWYLFSPTSYTALWGSELVIQGLFKATLLAPFYNTFSIITTKIFRNFKHGSNFFSVTLIRSDKATENMIKIFSLLRNSFQLSRQCAFSSSLLKSFSRLASCSNILFPSAISVPAFDQHFLWQQEKYVKFSYWSVMSSQ